MGQEIIILGSGHDNKLIYNQTHHGSDNLNHELGV